MKTKSILTPLFAVTTWKENRNLYQHIHTYTNIRREQYFYINFLLISCYDRLADTINQNDEEDDKLRVGGFTMEKTYDKSDT